MKRKIIITIGILVTTVGIFGVLPRFNSEAQQTCCPVCCHCNDTDCICTEPPLPYCEYLPEPCEPPTPPCEPHDCTLPACPEDTTSTNTGFLLDNLVSCDKGCGETKYGDCYEDPPGPPPGCPGGDCTSADIEFVLGSNQTNSLSCQSSVASGTEVNNPVSVRATYSHTVDINELEAIYFYMSEDGTNPPNIQWLDMNQGDTGKAISDESFGFMVRKVNGVWSDLYLPYVSDKAYWKYIGNISSEFSIDGPNELPMVLIHNLSIATSTDVVATFDIEFLFEDSGVSNYEKIVEEEYDVFGMTHDEFGFTPYDNYTNPQILNKLPYSANEIRFYDHWTNSREWIVDLTRPVVESVQELVEGPTEISVNWVTADSQSSIKYVVGSAYRSREGIVTEEPITYPFGSANQFDLEFRGTGDPSGQIGGSNSIWEVAGVSSRSESIGIGANRGGAIEFDVTTFDVACNSDTQSSTFRLGEWIETRGGFVYSRGGTNIDVRLLSAGVWSSSQWPTKYGLTEDTVDLSTELLAGGITEISVLKELRHETSNEAYRALGYNGLYRSDIYAHYVQKYEDISPTSTVSIATGGNLSGSLSSYCPPNEDCSDKIYVEKIDEGGLVVASNFSCDGKAVFLVDGELTINPDIENATAKDACIFVANGDVHIRPD